MIWVRIAAVSGAIGVAAGAFGAHALRDTLEQRMLDAFQTGVRYQLFHTLALLAVAWLAERHPRAKIAGWLFTAGIVLFAGSLYALALSGVRGLGAVTPFGGVCFIAGWVTLAVLSFRSSPRYPGA